MICVATFKLIGQKAKQVCAIGKRICVVSHPQQCGYQESISTRTIVGGKVSIFSIFQNSNSWGKAFQCTENFKTHWTFSEGDITPCFCSAL
jgi:hypothetical protein